MTDVENITDGIALLRTLEPILTWRKPRWGDLGLPVVDRGDHAIFPLAIAPLSESGDADALLETETTLRRHCIHFYGGDSFHAESVLSPDDGYGRKVLEAGAIPHGSAVLWWGIQNLAVVLVRTVDERQRLETLALHVLPKDWVWESAVPLSTKRALSHARSMARDCSAADVHWSWPLN
ncbi:hypothetical protein [Arthrobacter sp.]|uniref:hypothetical protein n=1 Tax=Arthrobacter sp. TaxID=1667 RepID=UPI002587264D|nr:hypothetical protein [Arthrobacter sp.]